MKELSCTWKRLAIWEMDLLLLLLFFVELLAGNRQLSPAVEHISGRGTWYAHELRFDGPRQRRSAIFLQDDVGTKRVDVLLISVRNVREVKGVLHSNRVDEETVHVKDTCSHWRKAAELVSLMVSWKCPR